MLPDFRFVIGAVLATSMLAVTTLGLFTATRLTPQGKSGPLETSRNLPFDDRSDWNQFYDPESTRRFEKLVRKSDVAAQPAADGPAEAAPAASTASEVAATPPDAPPSVELPASAVPASTQAAREPQTGEITPPEASPASADELRETGALPPASAARTPDRDEERPVVPAEPLAAAEQAPLAPANAIEIEVAKGDAATSEPVASEIARTEPTNAEPAKIGVPLPIARPAPRNATASAKPAARAPARAPAPKPRVATPTQQSQQGQPYWQQQQNWQQQYAPQQYAPQQSAPRQETPRPNLNDSFGQPLPRSSSQSGG